MFWLAEDDCGAAQSAASRSLQSGLDLYLRLRGLQLGAHAKSGGHSFGGVGRGRRVSAWAGFSPIGPRNIRNQLLATTRDEKQQAKHRIPQFFSSLLDKIRDKIPTTAYDAKKQEHRELQPEEIKATLVYAFVHDCFHGPM